MKKDGVGVENHSMFNPFDLLGLPLVFDVNEDLLNQAYFARQALVHPDRLIHKTELERKAGIAQAASLNQAYETLKNPALRAKALLNLKGLGAEENKTNQDPDVLEEMMDLQEQLNQTISPHDFAQLTRRIQNNLQEVQEAFSKAWNHHQEKELISLSLRLTYLVKFKEDIKGRQRQSSLKVL